MTRPRASRCLFVAIVLCGALAVRAAPGGVAFAPAVGTTIDAAPIDDAAGMVVAAGSTNGLLEIVIPRGTYLRIQAGELSAYNLPSVMNLRVGDRIVIHNEDDFPHILMYAFIPVGATDVRVLAQPGSEVYTAGCTPSAADFAPFTTIFITD